jgi:uncharacterized short protein YbdD (DUF466 family)
LTLGTVAKGVLWYLREVSGEADYDRYAADSRARHPAAAMLSRREFERRRMKLREDGTHPRCC